MALAHHRGPALNFPQRMQCLGPPHLMQTSVGVHFLENAFSIILDSLFADSVFIHGFVFSANLWAHFLIPPWSFVRAPPTGVIDHFDKLGRIFRGNMGIYPPGGCVEICFFICILNVHHHHYQPMFPPICGKSFGVVWLWDCFKWSPLPWKHVNTTKLSISWVLEGVCVCVCI